MTNQSTMDKLIEMRLTTMADAFRNQLNDPKFKEVPFEDQFGMLVDIETGILDQSFETVVFATAVFDIHQHTELILKGNLLEFWVIELVAECICHCGKTHFY